jgi:hypothetical protein
MNSQPLSYATPDPDSKFVIEKDMLTGFMTSEAKNEAAVSCLIHNECPNFRRYSAVPSLIQCYAEPA